MPQPSRLGRWARGSRHVTMVLKTASQVHGQGELDKASACQASSVVFHGLQEIAAAPPEYRGVANSVGRIGRLRHERVEG